MTAPRRVALALALASAGGPAILAGCGATPEGPAPPVDASPVDASLAETSATDSSGPVAMSDAAAVPDASTTDTGMGGWDALDAPPLDAPPDAATPFCAAEAKLSARCNPDGALCYDQDLSNCDIEGAVLSDAARQAYVDCEENLQCVTGLDFLSQPCVKTHLISATLTAAQTNLAHDFCAVCAVDSSCYGDFYQNGYLTGSDGPGFAMLQYNDDLVNYIDGRCLPVIPGDPMQEPCDFRFAVCIALALPARLPIDNCKDGGP